MASRYNRSRGPDPIAIRFKGPKRDFKEEFRVPDDHELQAMYPGIEIYVPPEDLPVNSFEDSSEDLSEDLSGASSEASSEDELVVQRVPIKKRSWWSKLVR